MIELHTFTFNAFSEQTYVLDHGNGEATVIDPGMSNESERNAFANFCDERGLTPVQVVLTHAHLDHVLGAGWVFDRWGLKPRLHAKDAATYEQAPRAAAVYGVPMDPLPPLGDELLEGAALMCGDEELEVRFTPGHAPGHIILIYAPGQWVIGGDVLFQGSVGRTDLPGSHGPDLVKSIESQVYTLPDDFRIWPGHGPATTVGAEKLSNPFVNAAGTGMMQANRNYT